MKDLQVLRVIRRREGNIRIRSGCNVIRYVVERSNNVVYTLIIILETVVD